MTDYPYGPTWVSSEPWGYAPYHYGRWAFVGDRWYWVPDTMNATPIYSPALVAFVPFGQNDIGWVPLGPGDVYVPHYYNTSWQPYYLTRDNLYQRVVNLDVPGAVTVVSVDEFTRDIDWRRARRADRNTLASVNPVLDPLLLTPLRNAVVNSAWGRGKKDIPPGIARKLQDTTVITSVARWRRRSGVTLRDRCALNLSGTGEGTAVQGPGRAPGYAVRRRRQQRHVLSSRDPNVSVAVMSEATLNEAMRLTALNAAAVVHRRTRTERGGPTSACSSAGRTTAETTRVRSSNSGRKPNALRDQCSNSNVRPTRPARPVQQQRPQAERAARPVQQPRPQAARPVQQQQRPQAERVSRPVERPQQQQKAQPQQQKQQAPAKPAPAKGGGKGKKP